MGRSRDDENDLGITLRWQEFIDMKVENYKESDYEAVCDFLIELNRKDRSHINWNWARFEWMAEHPEFDKSTIASIGLWRDAGKIIGAAICDMYFGEAFCGVLPGHEDLYPKVLEYAYEALKDDTGLAIAICDENEKESKAAKNAGFAPIDQTETIMKLELEQDVRVVLPEGLHFGQLDPVKDAYALQWLFWQGFDHGTDRAKFEQSEEIIPRIRRQFNPYLSVAAVDQAGEPVSCCCLWLHPDTDYVYVEPACTIPFWRGKGAAKAVIFEALRRAKELGAKQAYVISDMDFYGRLGFKKTYAYTFYRKEGRN